MLHSTCLESGNRTIFSHDDLTSLAQLRIEETIPSSHIGVEETLSLVLLSQTSENDKAFSWSLHLLYMRPAPPPHLAVHCSTLTPPEELSRPFNLHEITTICIHIDSWKAITRSLYITYYRGSGQ